MSDELTLEFWKNMALGLKDELIKRGNRIAELEAQLTSVSRALVSTDNADRYYRGFNDGFDHAMVQGWKPLENGIYNTDGPEVIFIKDKLLSIVGEHYLYLPKDYALCRRGTGETATTPRES